MILEQKELEAIRVEKEELRLKNKEETKGVLLLGNVWGDQDEGRKDQTKCMLSKLLHEKSEVAMDKFKQNQKKYPLDAATSGLGLSNGEMWPFMLSKGENEEGDAYEDLAEAVCDLAYFKEVLDKKKKKFVEAVNDLSN